MGELRISHCGHCTADPKSLKRGPKNQNFQKWEKKCPVCNTIVSVMLPIFAADVLAALSLPPADKLPKATCLEELLGLAEGSGQEKQATPKLPVLAAQSKHLEVFAKSLQQWARGFSEYCQRAECFGLQVDVERFSQFPQLLAHALSSLLAGLELRGFASELKEKAELYHNIFIAYRLAMATDSGQQSASELRAAMRRELSVLLRGVLAGDANLEGTFCRVVVLFVGWSDAARSPAQRARLSGGAQGGHAGLLGPLLHAPAAVLPRLRSRIPARHPGKRGLRPRDCIADKVLPDGHHGEVRDREPDGAQ